MPAIEWKDAFSVGLPDIDSDHKNLLKIFNDFIGAVEAGQAPEQLTATLDSLIHYVSYHFKHEESYFIRTNYPDYEIHKKDHERWMAIISDIYGKYKNADKQEVANEVMDFLQTFLNTHVMTHDRKFGLYFNNSHIML